MNPFPQAVPLLHDALARAADRLPDKVALVDRGVRHTYGELAGRAHQLAHALARRGVGRGDRVVVLAPNRAETLVAFWAALEADAVPSVLHPQTRPQKLSFILHDCRPAALVADGKLAPSFAGPASDSPGLRTVVVWGDVDPELLAPLPGGVAWDEALAAEPTGAPPPRRNIDEDLAAIIYTSGSTGDPKGVMQTHRSMIAAARAITTYLENREDDVILDVLPLSFDYGLYQAIMACWMGARLVLEPSFVYRGEVLARMVAEGVTGFPGVPTVFALLMQARDLADYDLSAVRYVTNTAAALPRRQIAFLREAFPRARLYSMYGLTECKRVSWLPPADLDRKPDSVGLPIPNTEVWIVDDAGRRLGPGEVGQIVVRGATVMRGYWERPEATAARLRPGPLPGERVLYTGDYGRLDEEGYLTFVGRMDDIIKCAGEKVAPKEVERALLDLDGVAEAAVVGVPDEVLGHAVKAYVVPEEGVTLDPRAVVRHCQGRLEGFMVPRHVEIVESLPHTSTGKISRAGLGATAPAAPRGGGER